MACLGGFASQWLLIENDFPPRWQHFSIGLFWTVHHYFIRSTLRKHVFGAGHCLKLPILGITMFCINWDLCAEIVFVQLHGIEARSEASAGKPVVFHRPCSFASWWCSVLGYLWRISMTLIPKVVTVVFRNCLNGLFKSPFRGEWLARCNSKWKQ